MKDKIINLYHKFLEVLKNCFDKLWGDDLPDIDTLFPPELYTASQSLKLYEEKQKKLACRRFFVFIFLICILVFVKNSIQDAIYAIKNIPAIACWNKPVCIYRGAKLVYPTDNFSFSPIDEKGNIFITGKSYRKYMFFTKKDYGKVVSTPLLSYIFSYSQNDLYYVPILVNNIFFEKYNIIKNKFEKIKIPEIYSKKLENGTVFFEKNKMISINRKNKSVNTYDFDKKEFKESQLFDNDLEYQCLRVYNNNILCISQNNDYQEDLKVPERLYLLDLKTMKLNNFAPFEKEPKFYPVIDLLTVLNNDKILVIFNKNLKKEEKFYTQDSKFKQIWDHIELYDPKTKRFYAYEEPIAKDNILRILFDNNDVLFLNKDSSYLFQNKTNTFVNVTNENKDFSNKLKNLLETYLLLNLKEDDSGYYNADLLWNIIVVNLSRQKYLILVNSNKKTAHKSIFIDYNNKIVTKGPDFPFTLTKHFSHSFVMPKNKTAIIGGEQKKCFSAESYFCPVQYAHIIEIKENKRKL
mgnify:CR=1 FL=1